jgi:hypothetical protein
MLMGLKLAGLLRPDVQYITVIQHLYGPFWEEYPAFRSLARNMLIISPGVCIVMRMCAHS